jgi:hypothetical protein
MWLLVIVEIASGRRYDAARMTVAFQVQIEDITVSKVG